MRNATAYGFADLLNKVSKYITTATNAIISYNYKCGCQTNALITALTR